MHTLIHGDLVADTSVTAGISCIDIFFITIIDRYGSALATFTSIVIFIMLLHSLSLVKLLSH
ncbi:hypothetical protein WS72_18230 [Burkholderia savannae]|uniref:Uncharacterized protein n=1 Tax=Burkholderia savannae TaxID=1637837 RepID=A0ABR5THY3_9BURK|nr:hypothetical protein WS72_18230 [Burkholderia savannae]